MLLTKKYLNSYLEDHFIVIPKCLKDYLLTTLGCDDHVYEFTEQDIVEQIRKAIDNYLYNNTSSPF